MDIARLHPDAIGLNIRKRLPTGVRASIEVVSVLLAWLGLVQSVLSILAQLTWVRDASIWLYQHAAELKPFVLHIASAVHVCVQFWRAITTPLYAFVFSAFPFEISPIVGDIIVVVLIAASGYIRYLLMKRAFEREERKDRLLVEDLYLHAQLGRPVDENEHQAEGSVEGWLPDANAEAFVEKVRAVSAKRLRRLTTVRAISTIQTALSVGLLVISLLGEWIYTASSNSIA